MAAQEPSFYYQFSKDFDYRKYLEQKSHFDRVELSVDTGFRKLIASNEELAHANILASDRIADQLQSGFDRLSVSLDSVRNSIDDLRSVCEYGFGEIVLSLNNIEDLMGQLISIAQTPDQTWALEQFSIAQGAFRRNLFEEALDYVDRAISGHGTRAGYRLEHRFYMMRGLIRLGNYKNFDAQIIDLDDAIRNFLLAAKYSEHDNKIDCSRSYGLAGWSAYCKGEFDKAELYLRKSVDLNSSDTQSIFDLSKTLLHQKKISEGLTYFDKAIRSDFKYGLRAGADEDFLQFRKEIEDCIEKYRGEIQKELRTYITKYDQLKIPVKQPILAQHNLGIDNAAQVFFDELRVNLHSSPLADLTRVKSAAPECLSRVQGGLENAKQQILAKAQTLRSQNLAKAQTLRSQKGEESSFNEGELYYSLFGLGAYVLAVKWGFSQGSLGGIVMLFVGLLIWIPAGWAGQLIIMPLIRGASNSRKRSERLSTAARLEKDASSTAARLEKDASKL